MSDKDFAGPAAGAIYRVQVTTARELLRMYKLDPRAALATSGDHPIIHFRLIPSRRTPTSLALRKLVADRMRELRRQSTVDIKQP